MAENDKRKFDLPWGTLLPLVAVVAGVVAQYKPLVSERPAVASEKTTPVIAEQDVDARLWQDPIGVAQKQKTALDAQIDAAKKGAADSHDVQALADLLRERVSAFHNNVLLLAVMLDAGPYSEQAESRLRARHAVLEGLSESGFAPVDGEHIGFVTARWPPQVDNTLLPPPLSAACAPPPAIERALLMPWEECEAIEDPKNVFPHDTKRVVVVWLPGVNFNPYPLRYFAALLDQLAPGEIRDSIDVRLIGPVNSTGLQNMVREARWHLNCLTPAMQKALDGVSVISPRASTSDAALLSAADVPASYESVKTFLEQTVPRGARGGLKFVRTIAPDDWILRELIAELARREIFVAPQAKQNIRPGLAKASHIVLLSEWDTPYGRSLRTTFAAEASGQNAHDAIAHPERQSAQIHPYHYLRGIDGRLPGDPGRDSQRAQEQKPEAPKTIAIEATEGLNQSDYLRRLARQMKEDNMRWQREDGAGIRAIGLLGSDIYDKLMILRALRPQFPGAVFFTNNYDAHFERHDEWDDTHNLVIASPFGSTVPEIYIEHRHIPPFRDSAQTATYVGTLVATSKMKQEEADCLSWQPRIFEISRHGAYDLSPPWYIWRPGDTKVLFEARYGKTEKANRWFRDWLFAPGVIWWLIVIALTVLGMAAWISVSIARRTLPGGGTVVERLRRGPVSTVFWLICAGPLIIFLVALVAQYWAPEEPLAFFSGISIWPTEMLRLIAFTLAIFFMFRASFDLRANAKKIEAEFSFARLKETPFRWRDLGIGFEYWQMKEPPETDRFPAEDAWHAYLCRSKFWPRCIRISVLFVLYFVFAATVFVLFPEPLPPARGVAAFKFDTLAFVLAGVGLLLLSFYVVDAIQLNSNFIRMFGREVTKWGRSVLDRSLRSPPLSEEELSAYHEIFFVAQRTKVVAPLIWYPLLVLTLLLVARSSFFDNWTWPPSLVLIFSITAAWALGSAILLRRAAEQLRETAINDLRWYRLKSQESETKRHAFDELIGEIRSLKTGAFAPLTEQPFVQAVLLPGGGLGLLAVAQRLFDIF
jgi:hypothetical protein